MGRARPIEARMLTRVQAAEYSGLGTRFARCCPVRINPALLRLLRLWKRKDGKIRWVINYEGDRVRKLRRSFKTAVTGANLAGVSAHTLRHTRATWLMQSGTVTPWEAAGSLGMSLRVLEEIYAHHHPDFQAAASGVGSRAISVPKMKESGAR